MGVLATAPQPKDPFGNTEPGNINTGSNKSNNVTLVGNPFTDGCK